MKSQKVYFSTFLLFFLPLTFRLFGFSSSHSTLNGLSVVLLAAHVHLKRHPAQKSKSQKVKRQKVYFSSFWLSLFALNGLTFALLIVHVQLKMPPEKKQKVKVGLSNFGSWCWDDTLELHPRIIPQFDLIFIFSFDWCGWRQKVRFFEVGHLEICRKERPQVTMLHVRSSPGLYHETRRALGRASLAVVVGGRLSSTVPRLLINERRAIVFYILGDQFLSRVLVNSVLLDVKSLGRHRLKTAVIRGYEDEESKLVFGPCVYHVTQNTKKGTRKQPKVIMHRFFCIFHIRILLAFGWEWYTNSRIGSSMIKCGAHGTCDFESKPSIAIMHGFCCTWFTYLILFAIRCKR